MYNEDGKRNYMSGVGIMLIGLTSCSIGSYLTYSWSRVISDILLLIALLCAGHAIVMYAQDIKGR